MNSLVMALLIVCRIPENSLTPSCQVKLDLDVFKQSSADVNPASRHSIACLFSRCSLIFRYLKETDKVGVSKTELDTHTTRPSLTRSTQAFSTLSITLQKKSDLETILRELDALNVSIEYGQASQDDVPAPGSPAFGKWVPQSQAGLSAYRSSSNPRQLTSSSPPLIARPGSQVQYLAYPEDYPHAVNLYRPPSQPPGRPDGLLPTNHRPWSPAFVPSRPATTLGVPGIMGEGIYKVSKIGSTSSSRPRVRRTSISEHQGPRLYTVSKHFDKTLGRADILHSSGARHPERRLSSGEIVDKSTEYLSRSPGFGASGVDPAMQPPMRTPGALEAARANTQHQSGLRKLRTIDDRLGSSSSPSAEFAEREHRSLLSDIETGQPGFAFSQAGSARGPVDRVSPFSSSPALFKMLTNPEMEDDWLVQISHIQHQGLCEASRVWDDLMEKASLEVASAESSGDMSEVLSKFKLEFSRRWEDVVATAAREMREVRRGGSAF